MGGIKTIGALTVRRSILMKKMERFSAVAAGSPLARQTPD
jgi:hypothetical protein